MPRKSKRGSHSGGHRGHHKKKGKKQKSNNNSPQKEKNVSNKSQPAGRPGRATSNLLQDLMSQLTHKLATVKELTEKELYETVHEIDQIVDKITQAQGGKNNLWGFEDVMDDTEETILSRFALWLKTEAPDCGLDERFAISSDLPEGRGLVALSEMADNTLALTIPNKIMITHSYITTKSDDKIRQFLLTDPMCKEYPVVALTVFVWHERMKGNKSFWRYYWDCLPRDFGLPHTAPLAHWLPLLKGTTLATQIIHRKIDHLKHYTYLWHKLRQSRFNIGLRLVDYMWASGIIMTRQNSVPLANALPLPPTADNPHPRQESERALIPLFDFCNYKSGFFRTLHNVDEHRSELYTMNDVKKGDQIYMYYGDQQTVELFEHTGFVVRDNPNDCIELYFQLFPHDVLGRVKQMQLSKLQLKSSFAVRVELPCPLRPIYEMTLEENKQALHNNSSDLYTDTDTPATEIESKQDDLIGDEALNSELKKRAQQLNVDLEELQLLHKMTPDFLSLDDGRSCDYMAPKLGIQFHPKTLVFARVVGMGREALQVFMKRLLRDHAVNPPKKTTDAPTDAPPTDASTETTEVDTPAKEESVAEVTTDEDVKENTVKISEHRSKLMEEDTGHIISVISLENERFAWKYMTQNAFQAHTALRERLEHCVNVHAPELLGMDDDAIKEKFVGMGKTQLALFYELVENQARNVARLAIRFEKGLDLVAKLLEKNRDPSLPVINLTQVPESEPTTQPAIASETTETSTAEAK